MHVLSPEMERIPPAHVWSLSKLLQHFEKLQNAHYLAFIIAIFSFLVTATQAFRLACSPSWLSPLIWKLWFHRFALSHLLRVLNQVFKSWEASSIVALISASNLNSSYLIYHRSFLLRCCWWRTVFCLFECRLIRPGRCFESLRSNWFMSFPLTCFPSLTSATSRY